VAEAVDPVAPDDLAAALHEEVGRLPERLRAAVVLCEFEGLSGEEAAGRLGCAVGTVKSRLARARERLRGRLDRRGISAAVGFPAAASGPVPPALLDSTVAAVVYGAGGRAGRLVTAAVAAWEAGVLRAMLMSKLKSVAVVLSFGLLAAGTTVLALGQIVKSKDTADQAAGKAEPELSNDQVLAVMARSRIEAARRVRDDSFRRYQGGEISLVQYYEAQMHYTDALLAVAQDPADRLAILRAQLKGTKALEVATRRLFERGGATRADVALAEYHRLDAAVRLAEAETGRRASLRTPLPPGLAEGATSLAVADEFARAEATLELQALLEKTVVLDLPDSSTLEAALKRLKEASTGLFDAGSPIYVDPKGIERAKVTMQTPVTVPKTACTLREAFRLVLEPIGLTYSVKDGLVWITAKAAD
jgi:hypothetical protein